MSTFTPGRHGAEAYHKALTVDVDVAIVGAGAGGCAAAAALAERGLRVALFEEGRHWQPSEFKQETPFALRNLYQDRGARSMRGNVIMALPGGRGVGGSTLINSAICFRCPDVILTQWREELGLHSMEQDRFNAYFDRVWSTIGVTTQSVSVQRMNNIIFKEGAEKLGLNGSFLPRSAPGCVGCGICQYGCPTGGKASVDRTFLVEALATGLVGVYADCKLLTAETEGDRVVAMQGQILDPVSQKPVGTVRVRADAFILSAGPIGSTVFLQNNGLSTSEHLGRHLVVHPTLGSLARFPFEIRPWHGVTQGYYVDMSERGFLLQTYTVTPDQYFALLPTAIGTETMRWMADLKHIASAGCLVHDEDSEGRVTATPLGADISYFLGPGDTRRLIDGLRTTGEVFFAAGAQQFLPFRIAGGVIDRVQDIPSRLPYDTPASDFQLYASHPMGTCRMGASEQDGVVDPTGRVWGWRNLRVADASVFPTSLGVNPQVTTMAVGLMVGHELADSRGV